jgi:hypothetical protein
VISRLNIEFIGKEIFHVQPVILGGDPVDESNKVILTRAEHIELVRYWNSFIADLKKTESQTADDSAR